ncbi:UNVERIFIED_CONTAM: hypothetical protein Sindi_1167500 [Sesamum indicum]
MSRRRGGNRNRPFGRRVWTTMEEECLIAALRNLVVTDWKCENGFRNGWNMVTVEDDSIWDDYVKMDPSAKGMRHKHGHFFLLGGKFLVGIVLLENEVLIHLRRPTTSEMRLVKPTNVMCGMTDAVV